MFGAKLKELRLSENLTQEELARKAGVSIGSVRNLEQGIREPSWDTVQKLAKGLGKKCADFEVDEETAKRGRGRPKKE